MPRLHPVARLVVVVVLFVLCAAQAELRFGQTARAGLPAPDKDPYVAFLLVAWLLGTAWFVRAFDAPSAGTWFGGATLLGAAAAIALLFVGLLGGTWMVK